MGINQPTHRRCSCGGTNPNCPQCGGKGVIEVSAVRPIMSGPAGIRRRLPVSRVTVETVAGPPVPVRCPHCGWEVLNLPAHLAESHPEHSAEESAAEKEAREREDARQAAIAAQIAQREAEAAQRKAEARARRQAIEGLPAPIATPESGHSLADKSHGGGDRSEPPDAAMPAPSVPVSDVGTSPRQDTREASAARVPSRPTDDVWERISRAFAERTVLTGVIRSRRQFGVFVDLGGMDGLVRLREMPPQGPGREAPQLREGQPVQVVVIGMRDDSRQVELSMRRASDPAKPAAPAAAPTPAPRKVEGPMAMAFRLAREKKDQSK